MEWPISGVPRVNHQLLFFGGRKYGWLIQLRPHLTDNIEIIDFLKILGYLQRLTKYDSCLAKIQILISNLSEYKPQIVFKHEPSIV